MVLDMLCGGDLLTIQYTPIVVTVLADRSARKRPLAHTEDGALVPAPAARPRIGTPGARLLALPGPEPRLGGKQPCLRGRLATRARMAMWTRSRVDTTYCTLQGRVLFQRFRVDEVEG
jgi:hypothetical protein